MMQETLRTIVEIGNFFFLIFVVLYTVFQFISVIYGAMEHENRARQRQFHKGLAMDNAINYAPISVLVPAYNEELTILDSVRSLCKLDYPEFEVIVIDDGSKDDTARVLIDALGLQKRERPIRRQLICQEALEIYESVDSPVPITLVRKKNGGKGDALNMGINLAKYPYFVSLDADSVLQKDTLKRLIMPVIEDSKVIAVGGMVQVANEAVIEDGAIKSLKFPSKFVVLMQMLEYSRTFLAMRMLLDTFNGNLIISGTIGLFRKDVVIQANGYNTNTVGEDMELVVKLHAYCRSKKIPYRIAYAPDAVCWTQVPERLRDLKSQRRRWHMGLMQSLSIHRTVLFNPLYGTMGLVSTLYYMLVEAIGPFIELAGFTIIILASILEMLNEPFMLWYFLLFYMLSAMVTITAFFTRMYVLQAPLTIWQAIKVVFFSFVEAFFFHHVITYFRMTALVNYRKSRLQWGKIQRRTHNRSEKKEEVTNGAGSKK